MTKHLPGIWFVVLLSTHYGIDALCAVYGVGPQGTRAWNYVGGQVEMTLAFATMAWLAGRVSWLIPLCLWGVIEHTESVVCRLVFPMDKPPPETGDLEGLCDVASGLPIYVTSVWVLLAAVLYWHQRYRRERT